MQDQPILFMTAALRDAEAARHKQYQAFCDEQRRSVIWHVWEKEEAPSAPGRVGVNPLFKALPLEVMTIIVEKTRIERGKLQLRHGSFKSATGDGYSGICPKWLMRHCDIGSIPRVCAPGERTGMSSKAVVSRELTAKLSDLPAEMWSSPSRWYRTNGGSSSARQVFVFETAMPLKTVRRCLRKVLGSKNMQRLVDLKEVEDKRIGNTVRHTQIFFFGGMIPRATIETDVLFPGFSTLAGADGRVTPIARLPMGFHLWM